MSGLVSGTRFHGPRGRRPLHRPGDRPQDRRESRFRSLQIGVCQESFGESIQRNMSWAGRDRPLPPEMIPHRLFDRLFGSQEAILDQSQEEHPRRRERRGRRRSRRRWRPTISSARGISDFGVATWSARSRACRPSTRRSSSSRRKGRSEGLAADRETADRSAGPRPGLAPDARRVLHADQVPGPLALSLAGLYLRAAPRVHARPKVEIAGAKASAIMRDICRWHVEEFAYFLAKLKSIPEGDGTLLDHTCLLFVHEHAEANSHKNAGLAMIAAGHAGKLKTGLHTRVTGTVGDLYLTLAEEVDEPIGSFPTARRSSPRSSDRHSRAHFAHPRGVVSARGRRETVRSRVTAHPSGPRPSAKSSGRPVGAPERRRSCSA